jgi:hypothetical protein
MASPVFSHCTFRSEQHVAEREDQGTVPVVQAGGEFVQAAGTVVARIVAVARRLGVEIDVVRRIDAPLDAVPPSPEPRDGPRRRPPEPIGVIRSRWPFRHR